MDDSLSLVLFSGTDDKLNAAAVLTAGAAAMGRKVNIFLQYWALDAFRADRDPQGPRRRAGGGSGGRGEPSSVTAASTGARSSARPRTSARSRSRPARCRWRCSSSSVEELDPLVDGQEGVAAFFLHADGPVTFI